MFNNRFNSTKKDPLVEAVQSAMQDGEIRRQAVAYVNEAFGVYNRNAVVREDLAAYDAAIEEAYRCVKEGKPLDPVGKEDDDIDNDGKSNTKSDKYLHNRRQTIGRAMGKQMEEAQIDEISKALALKAMKKSDERGEEEYDRDMTDDRLSDPKTHWDRAKRLRGHMKRKFGNKTIKTGGTDNLSPKSYEQGGGERRRADKLKKGPRAGMISAKHRDKLKDNIKYSLGKHKKPNLPEETQIDEIKVSTAYSYSGKKMEKERKGLLPGDHNPTSKTELKNMRNAAERTDKDYYKKRGFKKVEEALKGNQHRIDANKNNKIDSQDFKLLRARKSMKEEQSFKSAQATGKSVNEAPIAMPPAVQQPAPAVRGPAARLQGTKFYRGVNASTSGRGSARFVSPQTARVAPPPPKTGSSVVTSGNRMPTAGGSTSASRSLTTGASRSVTATPKATASGGSGFTYSRLGDREIGAAAGGARGLARSVARVASRVAGPAAVAADVVTPSGKTEPGNPVFRKTDTGKTSVAGYRSSTTPRAGTTDTNTTSRMVGDMSRRSGMAPSVRNQEVPKSISPVTTKEPGTLSAPAQKAAEPAAAKPSFSQAFAAARKEAGEKGSKSTGQFEFGGKKFQTNLAPAKGPEKFVAPTKQTTTSVKVDNPTTSKTVDAPLPPSRPADLGTTSATPPSGGAAAPARSTPAAPSTQDTPKAPPAPETPKDDEKKAKGSVSTMNESVVNVGGNKYRII